ncbi:hypothetical protein LTR37_017834 [Vermiconidia calcicola]|uniref:Uncharacterized protein n=1 Tax=Vermiconidia calcicola TaxID=1690605 RepID=A0ACC3MIZ0_9PEZI|nr:hypothetical protein LTR37_017834 [Vermiconidia calcicola]
MDRTMDIAGLREQIIANGLSLFPDKAAYREQYPVSDNFNVNVIAVPTAGEFAVYQATLVVLRTFGQVETLLKGRDARDLLSALQNLLWATAVALTKSHGRSFGQASTAVSKPDV